MRTVVLFILLAICSSAFAGRPDVGMLPSPDPEVIRKRQEEVAQFRARKVAALTAGKQVLVIGDLDAYNNAHFGLTFPHDVGATVAPGKILMREESGATVEVEDPLTGATSMIKVPLSRLMVQVQKLDWYDHETFRVGSRILFPAQTIHIRMEHEISFATGTVVSMYSGMGEPSEAVALVKVEDRTLIAKDWVYINLSEYDRLKTPIVARAIHGLRTMVGCEYSLREPVKGGKVRGGIRGYPDV